jgi:hypothetical protein
VMEFIPRTRLLVMPACSGFTVAGHTGRFADAAAAT